MNYERESKFNGLICEDVVCLCVQLVDIRSIVLSPSVYLSIHSQVSYRDWRANTRRSCTKVETHTYVHALINIVGALTLLNTPPDTLIQMHSLLKRRHKFWIPMTVSTEYYNAIYYRRITGIYPFHLLYLRSNRNCENVYPYSSVMVKTKIGRN